MAESNDAFLGRFRDGDRRWSVARVETRRQVLRGTCGPVRLAQGVVMLPQQAAARSKRQDLQDGESVGSQLDPVIRRQEAPLPGVIRIGSQNASIGASAPALFVCISDTAAR